MEFPTKSPIVDITLDSVTMINSVIDTDVYKKDSLEEKKDHVKRNVDHLVLMLANDEFNAEATALQKELVNQSIAKGNTYISTL
jgi:hypothetical protein